MFRAALNIILVLLIAPAIMVRGQGLPSSKSPTVHSDLRSSISISKFPGSTVKLLVANNSVTPELLQPKDRDNQIAAQNAAVNAVHELTSTFGIPSTATIEPAATIRVANVWQTSFQFSYGGIPVRDCRLHTTIGAITGKLMTASCDLAEQAPNTTTPNVSSSAITSSIPAYLGDDRYFSTSSISTPTLVYVSLPHAQIRLAYELTVRQSEPAHAWRLTVDAASERLLEKKDMLEYIGGDKGALGGDKGVVKPQSTIRAKILCQVHPHSPFDDSIIVGLPNTMIIVDGVPVITDDSGYWTTDVLNLYPNIVTGFFNSTYHVERKDGKTDTARVYHLEPPSYFLLWNDFDSKPAERDAWYHVNFARTYMQSLDPGLTRLDDSLTINVNIPASCNAFYDADINTLNFFSAGGACSNTGEIADIIYHEFGHRVAAVRYLNGSNGRQVNATLSEGFADLCSAFMRDDPQIGIGFYRDSANKILRSCENSERFTGTVNSNPHVAGEIIAGAFWDLRKMIGHDTAERLFHEMEWLNPDGPDQTGPDVMTPLFGSVLMDVLTLDDDNNNLSDGTPHSDQIIQAFANHGIYLSSFLHLQTQKTADQDSAATGYPVIVEATYVASLGTIDLTKFSLHYSIDGWKTSKTQPFNPIPTDSTHFLSIIPKQSAGSIVSYYASAGLTIDSGGQTTTPTESFMVGFSRASIDDCEQDRGWSLSLPTEDAVRGRWIRAVPYGTYNIPDHWIQQDTDHSPNGTMCYVTGNMYSREIWSDCVDSGTTTLTTNSIDLSEASSPVLRYWYFYSNDQVFLNGVPEWITQISGDGGSTWKGLQRVSSSTDGWQSFWFRVSDFVPGATHVRIRFIASNLVQAVVEAGVDDLEVLATGSSPATVVRTQDPAPFRGQPVPPLSSVIQSIFPNPATPTSELTVQFSLAERSRVTLLVKNVFGEIVTRLADETLGAGSYSVTSSASPVHLEPGVYWAVLSTGSSQSIRKIVIQ